MKCKDCKEVMCKHRSTNAEMDCVLQVDVLKEHRFPKSKVWHYSNTEQPKRGSSIVVVKGRSGDVIDRVVEVYPNRIWAYLDDLLGMENSVIKTTDQETVSEELEKEIDNYIKDNFFGSETYGFCSNRTGGELDCVDVVNIARHFANWQKKQDQETIELAEDHAMLAGIIKGTEHTIGNVRSILNKIAYENNGLDVNGDYCEQPYLTYSHP